MRPRTTASSTASSSITERSAARASAPEPASRPRALCARRQPCSRSPRPGAFAGSPAAASGSRRFAGGPASSGRPRRLPRAEGLGHAEAGRSVLGRSAADHLPFRARRAVRVEVRIVRIATAGPSGAWSDRAAASRPLAPDALERPRPARQAGRGRALPGAGRSGRRSAAYARPFSSSTGTGFRWTAHTEPAAMSASSAPRAPAAGSTRAST